MPCDSEFITNGKRKLINTRKALSVFLEARFIRSSVLSRHFQSRFVSLMKLDKSLMVAMRWVFWNRMPMNHLKTRLYLKDHNFGFVKQFSYYPKLEPAHGLTNLRSIHPLREGKVQGILNASSKIWLRESEEKMQVWNSRRMPEQERYQRLIIWHWVSNWHKMLTPKDSMFGC